jgi:hypothetical protein
MAAKEGADPSQPALFLVFMLIPIEMGSSSLPNKIPLFQFCGCKSVTLYK